jgi:hypothetical protein
MENKATKAEWQLKYAEQDAIIENAEVVGYDMLIQVQMQVDPVLQVPQDPNPVIIFFFCLFY